MSTQCYSKLEEHNIEISSHPLPPYNYQETQTEQEHIESNKIIIKQSENNISFTDSDVYVEIPSYDNSQQIIIPQNNIDSKVNKISHTLLFIWYVVMIVMYWIVINNIINNDTINMFTTMFFLLDISTMYAYVIKKTHYQQSFTQNFMNIIIFFGLCSGIVLICMFFQNLSNAIIFPFITVIIKVFLGLLLILD